MAGDRRAELHGHQITHHREKFAAYLRDGSAEMWLVNDNADYWGCCLPLEDIEPFFRALPPSCVLTVGDGKGGKEAAFLKRLGHHAVATDVSTDVLAEAKQRGIIDNFREEDAEALSFADESFDYVLVKETLHHLTRPYLALYEMLRVASRGVIVIEPRTDLGAGLGLRACFRYILGRLLRICSLPRAAALPKPVYEKPAGNFCFCFHPYDLAQVAIAAGCEAYAWTRTRAYWEPDCEKIKGEELAALIERETKRMEGGREAFPMLAFIMLKEKPSPDAIAALQASAFEVELL
ncbi:MAG: class I SAM-dependent methyltransferase [Planctomycetota bacterium]|jgi:SAM-dependent methyltransferase